MQEARLDYPEDFPEHLRPPVDAAFSQAEIEFAASDHGMTSMYAYIYTVWVAFANQACRAGQEGLWAGDRIRKAVTDYHQNLAEYVYYQKHRGRYDSNERNKLTTHTKWAIEDSNDWAKIQLEMKRVAETPRKGTDKADIIPAPGTPPVKTRIFREPKPELLKNSETVNKSQAAAALGVTTRQLDRYVKDNLLTPVGDFGRRRFKTKDLRLFLNRGKRDI